MDQQFVQISTKLDGLVHAQKANFHDRYEEAKRAIESLNPKPPYNNLADFKQCLAWLEHSENSNLAVSTNVWPLIF